MSTIQLQSLSHCHYNFLIFHIKLANGVFSKTQSSRKTEVVKHDLPFSRQSHKATTKMLKRISRYFVRVYHDSTKEGKISKSEVP